MFELPRSCVDEYRARSVPFGWGGVGEVAFYRTYSRKDNPKAPGVMETWADVCERVINGMYQMQEAWCKASRINWNAEKAMVSAKEAFDLMYRFKWSPPGRGLWMMGTDFVMKRGTVEALQNCFAGDELFITKEYGVSSFAELAGEKVTVWTEKGWQPSEVKSFGTQPLQAITFAPAHAISGGYRKARSNVRTTIKATPNHRWLLANGRETTALAPGDIVITQQASHENSRSYNMGMVHGLIFGDGVKISHRYANGDYGFELRACGEKKQWVAESLLGYFDKVTTDRPSANGDPIYYKRSTDNLKDFPKGKDPAYVAGFLIGWIAADAYIGKQEGGYKLTSTHPLAHDWLSKHAALCGFSLTGHGIEDNATNYGERNLPLHRYTLTAQEAFWVVESIAPLDEEEPVYCAVVPDIGRFTLASGIYTGNCGFISSEFIARERGDFFRWLMEHSMLGVGVGFDTRGAGKVRIHRPLLTSVYLRTIPDTREGWAHSVEILINSYLDGVATVDFDYSEIRPRGSLIHGFGGVASGPDPLIELHEAIRLILDSRAGKLLDSRTIVDLCNLIGKCVVSGNVRRSAEIALGSPLDEEFINLKNYEQNPERADYGWVSNNSLLAEVGMDYKASAERTWINGEPGFFWISNAQSNGRMDGLLNYDDVDVMGCNPCVTGDTLIYTEKGLISAEELAAQQQALAVVTDSRFGTDVLQDASPVFTTGVKDVYRLRTVEGYEVRATDNHRIMTSNGWVAMSDLKEGDQVHILNRPGAFGDSGSLAEGRVLGWLVGDGHFNTWAKQPKALLSFWQDDIGLVDDFVRYLGDVLPEPISNRSYSNTGYAIAEREEVRIGSTRLYKMAEELGMTKDKLIVPDKVRKGSAEMQRGFLQAIFSSDGHFAGTQEKGGSVRLTSVSEGLLKDVQRLLLNFGIYSRLYRNRRVESIRELPDGKGGSKEYACQAYHDLCIAKRSMAIFADTVGFIVERKQSALLDYLRQMKRGPYSDTFVARVASVTYEGKERVYDLTQPSTHSFVANGIVVHNCGEQPLHHRELCTLVEIYLPHCHTKAEFLRAIKYAYLYGKTTTLASYQISDARTRGVMTRNRRIGLSVTGVTQFLGQHGAAMLADWLDHGYHVSGYYDQLYSQWLGVNQSIRRTSVKPGGTVPLVAGTTPGAHFNVAGRFHIRRIVIDDDSPLLGSLRDAGYRMEPSIYTRNSTVVEFPVDAGVGVRSEDEVTTEEQLQVVSLLQRYWSDNAVSATVKFSRDKTSAADLQRLLEQYQYQLKGISFLPKEDHGYAQAPYESITQGEYMRMAGKLKPLRIDTIGGSDKRLDMYCEGDACTVPGLA